MIVNSEYNENTGTANVVVRGKHGYIGSGKARLHEEDREYGSEIIGCGIAHARGRIKCIFKQMNAKIAEVNRLATEISNDMTELEASISKREYLHKKMSKSRN